MGFSQALSGLNAAATNLEVIGNNIANSQTVGFKAGKTLFADVFAEAKGLGTRVSDVMQNFSTGTLENTGRELDLAISGNGFFRFIQNGQVVYSRNGQLNLDAEGFFINAQGARLTGFPSVGAGAEPVPLAVGTGSMQANATTSIEATLNLDSGSLPIDRVATPFDQTDANTFSYANNLTLFDSQGNAHNATAYFTKTADNTWEVQMSLGAQLAPQLATLTFDQDGVLASAVNFESFTFSPGGGVADIDVSLDLDVTQFGNDFEWTSINQDGHTSGSLVNVIIDEGGNIIGNYSNQQTQVLGSILLANFTNPEGLRPVGDNAWIETTESGQPLLGNAGTGQLGTLQGGVVENSNVDLTKELVNMIIAQRNYQANSQTIKVQDEVLQEAVNLR